MLTMFFQSSFNFASQSLPNWLGPSLNDDERQFLFLAVVRHLDCQPSNHCDLFPSIGLQPHTRQLQGGAGCIPHRFHSVPSLIIFHFISFHGYTGTPLNHNRVLSIEPSESTCKNGHKHIAIYNNGYSGSVLTTSEVTTIGVQKRHRP